jgi:hypothetical protein
VKSEPSGGTAITGILLQTSKPLVREPGVLRKYGKEEENGKNLSQVTNK